MSSEQILAGLQITVDTYSGLRVVHHLFLIVVFIFFIFFKEKVSRLVSLYILLAFLTIFLTSLAPIRNIFYLIVFGFLTILAILEFLNPKNDYSMKGAPTINIIIALVAGFLGFWYPHFVEGYFKALYASPYGVIPCPTLLVILSFFLVFYPYTNRFFHWVLAIVGLFFGFFGLFVLKVRIDLALLALSLYTLYSLILLGAKKPQGGEVL